MILVVFSFLMGAYVSFYLNTINKNIISNSLLYFGIQEYEDGNIRESMKYLFSSIYFNPEATLSHNILAKIFYAKGLYDLADSEFKEFIKNPPKDKLFGIQEGLDIEIPMAYCYLAEISKIQNNIKSFYKYYEIVLSEYPKFFNFLKVSVEMVNSKEIKNKKDIERIETYSTFLYSANLVSGANKEIDSGLE